jgi:hypothetical protein
MPPKLPVGKTPPAVARQRSQTEQTRTAAGRPPTEPTKTDPTKTEHGEPTEADEAPARRSSFDQTPLPKPLPYHVADPTTSSAERISDPRLSDSRISDHLLDQLAELSETAPTNPGEEPQRDRSTMRDLPLPDASAFASAVRKISALVASASDDELVTREIARLDPVDAKPPTLPTERVELYEGEPDDESLTPPPRDGDEERTYPRDLPLGAPSEQPAGLANSFFAPLPPRQRTAVLTRFVRRQVKAGIAVIRQGEAGHPLVAVVSGRLDAIVERANGSIIRLGTVEAGDFFGEVALLAHGPSPAQLVAATDSDLLVLPARELYEIAGAFPSLWSALKDRAERRAREIDAKLKAD